MEDRAQDPAVAEAPTQEVRTPTRPPDTWARKLCSLTGVLPLGVFVVVHLWVAAAVLSSRDVYERQVRALSAGAVGRGIAALVLIPLLFHAATGLWLSTRPLRDPVRPHNYGSDLAAAAQRVTGVVVLVFVSLHVWQLQGQTWTRGLEPTSYTTVLVEHLSASYGGVPWIALGYLVGVAATIHHLVLGVMSFFTTWGLARTAAQRSVVRVVSWFCGTFFFIVSSAVVIQLATGARFFPADKPSGAEQVCGPSGAESAPAQSAATPSALPSGAH